MQTTFFTWFIVCKSDYRTITSGWQGKEHHISGDRTAGRWFKNQRLRVKKHWGGALPWNDSLSPKY